MNLSLHDQYRNCSISEANCHWQWGLANTICLRDMGGHWPGYDLAPRKQVDCQADKTVKAVHSFLHFTYFSWKNNHFCQKTVSHWYSPVDRNTFNVRYSADKPPVYQYKGVKLSMKLLNKHGVQNNLLSPHV